MNSLFCVSLLAFSGGHVDGRCRDAIEIIIPGCGCAESYVPQPGDIVLFSNPNPLIHALYYLSLTGGVVTHVGLVVALPNGRTGLLEAPFCKKVTIGDPEDRLRGHRGKVYVRRRIQPLTQEESAKLTAFAWEQLDKPFHLSGMALPCFSHPVHSPSNRCPVPEDINRSKWICSSLVVASGVAAGLMNPCVVRPTKTSASDLYSDSALDLSRGWERPALIRVVRP